MGNMGVGGRNFPSCASFQVTCLVNYFFLLKSGILIFLIKNNSHYTETNFICGWAKYVNGAFEGSVPGSPVDIK